MANYRFELTRKLLLLMCTLTIPAIAQHRVKSRVDDAATTTDVQQDSEQSYHPPQGITVADYVFGPGDVISISITDSPEMSGAFQVSNDGIVALPYIGQLKVAGLNGIQVTKALTEALKKSDILTDPIVNVAVEEYHSRTVQVLGAVAKPGEYPLQRPTRVLDVIAHAGGLSPNAGNTITISHQGTGVPVDLATRSIDISKLARGQDRTGNIEIQPGDVVNVSAAPIIYVIGAVNRPGGFAITDTASGVTTLQAVALAEGIKPIAAPKRALLIRASVDGKPRERFPVDIASILSNKSEDEVLQPNDILYIPDSGTKKTLDAMQRIAEGGAIGAATYGIGLRAAQ